MKKVLLFFLLLISFNCTYAQSRSIVRQQPYINNPYYRHYNYYRNEVLPRDLSALEKYSMNRIYSRENPLRRLERLESLTFGSIQSGDIESRYKNVETAILSRPRTNTKRTVLGTLANYLNGQPTGITPSVFDNFGQQYMPAYDNFIHNSGNSYSNSRINRYSNGIWGNGYSVQENSLGNGSFVRILD